MDDHIAKPINPDNLFLTMADWLHAAALPDALTEAEHNGDDHNLLVRSFIEHRFI
jgi:hypothetical protein